MAEVRDDHNGRFVSTFDAHDTGFQLGLQIGADNVRVLLARRGELNAEMAGAITALHGAPPLAEGPTATDAFRMVVEMLYCHGTHPGLGTHPLVEMLNDGDQS